MQLTNRDMRILERLTDYRLLTREQIQRLEFSPTSTTACKRRLGLLYHNGYVGRLALPINNAYGATRVVYFIDRLGSNALSVAHRNEQRPPARTVEASPIFLEHTLDVADVRIAFELACVSLSYDFAWISEGDLRRAGVRVRLSVSADRHATTIPDGLLAITASGECDSFAVEVDRGTVSEDRMRRRFRGYGEWSSHPTLPATVGSDSLRVLIVVTANGRDRKRLEHLKTWCEAEGGRSLFWFTSFDAATPNIITTPVWQVAGQQGYRALALSGRG